MRKQFIKTTEKILDSDKDTILLLGDIGVFGFRESFKNYPDRVYNIGILEQSMVSMSAGLSMFGLTPILHTIAPFLVERSFEQIKLDFGVQELCGNFVSVGGSYDYAALGPTHHCPGDVSILLTIPNIKIIVPGTSKEFDSLFNETFKSKSPNYFRLSEFENNMSFDVSLGKANVIKTGNKGTIICVGNMLEPTIKATENLDVTILYYTTITPFDTKTLNDNFNENIITVEPFYQGSINNLIVQSLKGRKYQITNIGVPNSFLKNYGTKEEHDINLGLDTINLNKKILECLM